MFLKEFFQLFCHQVVYNTPDFAVAQFCFCLSFKLGFLYLDADDSGNTLTAVVAAEVFVVFF